MSTDVISHLGEANMLDSGSTAQHIFTAAEVNTGLPIKAPASPVYYIGRLLALLFAP
jgi:hypothetical protein